LKKAAKAAEGRPKIARTAAKKAAGRSKKSSRSKV
jgi:hypothetical protein